MLIDLADEKAADAAVPTGDPLDIVILTCRPADSDFRYPLARELHLLGHRVTYIFLKRRPEVTDMAVGTPQYWTLPRLLAFFARLRFARRRPIIFNSTNLAFPDLSILLRRLSGTRWCLDMHDDLLYDIDGPKRARMERAQKRLVANSDMIVHAAPTLAELFPTSHHIGNASSLRPLPKTTSDGSRVLILASLDQRFDFSLMAQAARACPHRLFDIYGRISRNDPVVQDHLDRLVAGAPNISYHGPYTDSVLPDLLARYLVAFAPYKVGTPLTHFIDPLRFYHCLASRTGLVSTGIPQALAMQDQIELVSTLDDLDAALDRAIAGRDRNGGRTWRDVAVHVAHLFRKFR